MPESKSSLGPIGVGIIGYGPNTAAHTFHVPLIAAEPGLQLKVVLSRHPEVAQTLLPGTRVVSDVDGVLERVDLVVVATPTATHYDFAKRALLAGKHVVVEKPLATTAAQADELIALAQKQGLVLSQFHNRRWDGGFLTTRRVLEEARCGKLAAYEAYYDRFVQRRAQGWRAQRGPGSGILYDLGIHLIDQTLVLLGRPQSISATVRMLRADAQVDDYFHLMLDYGAMQAVLGANMLAASPGPRYKLSGSHGTYEKYGLDPQVRQLNSGLRPGDAGWGEDKPDEYGTFYDGSKSEPVPTLAGNYQSFYAGIASAIAGTPAAMTLAQDARDGIALIEAAFRSSEEGRTIPAKEIGFSG